METLKTYLFSHKYGSIQVKAYSEKEALHILRTYNEPCVGILKHHDIESKEKIIKIIKITFDRNDYPGLITGDRKHYIVDTESPCPECGAPSTTVVDYLGSLFYFCRCPTKAKFWKTDKLKTLHPEKLERQSLKNIAK